MNLTKINQQKTKIEINFHLNTQLATLILLIIYLSYLLLAIIKEIFPDEKSHSYKHLNTIWI